MERVEVEVDGVTQRSGVQIKRCRCVMRLATACNMHRYCTAGDGTEKRCPACMRRYLAESGCAGMCVNLCKSPTQVVAPAESMPLWNPSQAA